MTVYANSYSKTVRKNVFIKKQMFVFAFFALTKWKKTF